MCHWRLKYRSTSSTDLSIIAHSAQYGLTVLTPSSPRADAARQKSEALRSLATQLIEEHADYTKKNEQVRRAAVEAGEAVEAAVEAGAGVGRSRSDLCCQVAEYRLEERNRDVEFWKKELEEETEAMKVTENTMADMEHTARLRSR